MAKSIRRAIPNTKLWKRIEGLHPNHRRIAAGALLIGILTLVAKAFAAFREMVIAYRFGVGQAVDAYQLALTITTWVPTMVTSVMTVVLVPRLVALHGRRAEHREFISELNGTALVLGLALASVTWIVAPAASVLLASKLDSHTLALTVAMSRQMSVITLLSVAVGYLSVRLQARERFAYSVTEAIPALSIALLVLLPGGMAGDARLVAGTVIGFIAQALLLGAMAQRGDRGFGSIKFHHRSDQWPSVYRSLAVMAAGTVTLSFSAPIDQAFAARLGAGSVATLAYANRILMLITGFGAIVLARAMLPVLSKAAASGEHALGQRQALQWAWLLMIFGGIVGAVAWALSDWGTSMVFERGAFTAADSRAVAHVLRYGALQLPFYFGGLALVQWMASRSRYSGLLATACIALAVKVAMNLLLVPLHGLHGIMMATAGMYAVSFGSQYYLVRKK